MIILLRHLKRKDDVIKCQRLLNTAYVCFIMHGVCRDLLNHMAPRCSLHVSVYMFEGVTHFSFKKSDY